MHFSTLLAVALSTTTMAVTVYIPALPDCAQTSLVFSVTGGCERTDFTCICKAPALWQSYQTSVGIACSPEDAASAVNWGVDFCAKANYPVSAKTASVKTTAAKTTTAASTPAVNAATTTAAGTAAASATPKSDAGRLAKAGGGIGMLMGAAIALGI